MKVGIVGLPGAGKTAVFAALTGITPDPAAPPGRTTLGVVHVKDARLARLSAMYPKGKVVRAEVTFADVACAGGKRSLDRATLTSMRDFDAFAQVLRGFAPPAGDPPDPLREIRDLDAEVVLADVETVDRKHSRLAKGEKQGFTGEKDLLGRFKEALEAGTPLRDLGLTADQRRLVAGYAFLSLKPVLYVLNVGEAGVSGPAPAEVLATAAERGAAVVVLSAEVERQIAELDETAQVEFLADLGLAERASDRFIAAAYAAMDLVSFFTVGDDEVRAWTIRRGTPAVAAAGKIHTDLEHGFIRAEVIKYEDLVTLGSEAKCREAGKLRAEGKIYVVQDGDVLHVRFSPP